MKHSLSLLEVKKCIEHDLEFSEQILVSNDLGETFNNPFCGDSNLIDWIFIMFP